VVEAPVADAAAVAGDDDVSSRCSVILTLDAQLLDKCCQQRLSTAGRKLYLQFSLWNVNNIVYPSTRSVSTVPP